MNYYISTNQYFVRLSLEGMPTLNSFINAIRESAQLINKNHCDLFFIDGSLLTSPFDIADKFSVVNQLDKLGLSRRTQIVLVTSSTYFDRNTLENMGYNRGWRINTFKKLQQAKDWIESFIDVNYVDKKIQVS